MPTNTYTALATTTVAVAASSITFSSIPATYRDLVVVMSGTLSADSGVRVVFNGDTNTANYSRVFMEGNGSSASSGSGADNRFIEVGTSQSNFVLQVLDYSATDKHKTSLARSNQSNRIVWANAGRWANTAAVTSLMIDPDSVTLLAVGTTIGLYGIAG